LRSWTGRRAWRSPPLRCAVVQGLWQAACLRVGLLTACGALVQDHKAVGEGDTGPNTGGMGAYSPAPVVTADVEAQVMRDIVQRTADAMVDRGVPFSGVLFAGLMIKDGRVRRRPCKLDRPGRACHGQPAWLHTANACGCHACRGALAGKTARAQRALRRPGVPVPHDEARVGPAGSAP